MYKVIDSSKVIREDGKPVYSVTVASRYGIFSGKASPCDEDAALKDDNIGYKLAEYKCNMKILQTKAGILRERMNGVRNVCDALSEKYRALYRNGNTLTNDTVFIDALVHQYNICKREYKYVYSKYTRMRDNYKNYVDICLSDRKRADEYIAKKRSEETE